MLAKKFMKNPTPTGVRSLEELTPVETSGEDMHQRDIQADQIALYERLETTSRWLKRRMNYRGSKDTADIRDIAVEKLLKSEVYGPRVRQEPHTLMGMCKQAVTRVMLDLFKASRARPQHRLTEDLHEHLVAHEAVAEAHAINRARLQLLEQELQSFEVNGHGLQIRPKNRARMVNAFRLKLQGHTDAQIGTTLGAGRSTVTGWLNLLTDHLAERIVMAEAIDA